MNTEPLRIRGVEAKRVLELASYAERGYACPDVEQDKHGGELKKLAKGRYSADFFGFILVGKFGSPETAAQKLANVNGQKHELFGLTPEQMDVFVLRVSYEQEFNDVGALEMIHKLRLGALQTQPAVQ